jgi:hypothetical protein
MAAPKEINYFHSVGAATRSDWLRKFLLPFDVGFCRNSSNDARDKNDCESGEVFQWAGDVVNWHGTSPWVVNEK